MTCALPKKVEHLRDVGNPEIQGKEREGLGLRVQSLGFKLS